MTVFSILILVGLIECLVAIPLVIKKIPRNLYYGFRFTKTMAEDRFWYPANQRGGLGLILCGVIVIACGVMIKLGVIDEESNIITLAIIAPTIILAIDNYFYVRKLD